MENAPISPEKTARFGALIDPLQAFFVDALDYAEREGYVISFTSRYEKNREGSPWVGLGYPDHHLTTCCLWPHAASGIDFRCVLSEEGFVNIYGPGGKPDRTFQIPEAGVFGPTAAGFGYVQRIRAIGEGLYVCGAHRQVHRYVPGERNPLSGRWVNVAGAMRQPPLGPAPEKPKALERWLAQDVTLFNDIAGSSESDIYVTGDETWHFDGQQWQQIQLPVSDAPMHVIKVLNAEQVLLGGSNGYLLKGNARQGFRNISHAEDKHTITGLEWFDGKLFIASDAGLFTYNPQTQRQEPYRTDLEIDLVDTHLLEAKEGVLWSFGFKDLAYLDTRQAKPHWVRVHNPDNPRVDEKRPQQASRQPPAVPEEAIPHAQALAWLPLPSAGRLDVGGLIARVGHRGIGAFVLAQLAPFGLQPEQVLRVNARQRYTVHVPQQGVELELQCMSKAGADGQQAERWALAQVRLLTQSANPHSAWQGPWPGALQPHAQRAAVLTQAKQLWGDPQADSGGEQSYFVDGAQGTAWVISLSWDALSNRLHTLAVAHLGGYLPWPDTDR